MAPLMCYLFHENNNVVHIWCVVHSNLADKSYSEASEVLEVEVQEQVVGH